jgi:hypothetical protein
MAESFQLLLSVIICATVVIVIWSLYAGKGGAQEQGAFSTIRFFNNLNPASPVVGAFIVVSGLSCFFHFQTEVALTAAIALGFTLVIHSFTLAINVDALERSCAVFALVMLGSSLCPPQLIDHFAFGSIMGLCLSKLIEIRRSVSPVPVQDIIPACVWLAGLMSLRAAVPGLPYPNGRELLALLICTTFLLRLFQPPFLVIDHLFVKRVALALTGGMVMFVVIVKYFQMPSLGTLSALFSLGYFFAYLAEQIDAITARDNEKHRAIMRSGLVVAASAAALIFQPAAASFGIDSVLMLAAAMCLAESSFTAGALSLYWIATTVMSRLHINAAPSAYYWLEGNLGTMLPVIGGAFALVGFATAIYLHTCMPRRTVAALDVGQKRPAFDWAQTFAFISMSALLIVSIMPPQSSYEFMAVVVNMVLVVSVWRDVFLRESTSPRSQGILLMVNLVCLTCLLSNPGAFLLSCGFVAIIYSAWQKISSESDPITAAP